MANVGLDFGTHQTKICIELGEDINSMSYTFLKFKDRYGNDQFVLPSVIQINKDNTLSYGYVDTEQCQVGRKRFVPDFNEEEPQEPKLVLLKKPLKKIPKVDDRNPFAAALGKALLENEYEKAYQRELDEWEKKCEPLRIQHIKAVENYKAKKLEYERKLAAWNLVNESADGKMLFRNFKQASFLEESDYPWPYEYRPEILSIWYLAYVLFQLDRYFEGDTYTLNVGIPTGKKKLKLMQRKAVSLYVSAFKLMEKFGNDYDAFIASTVTELYNKTEVISFSDERDYADNKYYYAISVFPESYAGLYVVSAKGALTSGFHLLMDIGGGTTDITFFAVNSNELRPMIYSFESVPKGLNFLTEYSMPETWDKMNSRPELNDPQIDKDKLQEAIDIYKRHVSKSVRELQMALWKEWEKTTIRKDILNHGLTKRPVIYTGGGSSFNELWSNYPTAFSDLNQMNGDYWTGLYIDDNIKKEVKKKNLYHILSVCLGLANSQIGLDGGDERIEKRLFNLDDIFSNNRRSDGGFYDYGKDKDLQDLG